MKYALYIVSKIFETVIEVTFTLQEDYLFKNNDKL